MTTEAAPVVLKKYRALCLWKVGGTDLQLIELLKTRTQANSPFILLA